MYCQKCGTQNPDEASFCNKCGKNLAYFKPEIENEGESEEIERNEEHIVKNIILVIIGIIIIFWVVNPFESEIEAIKSIDSQTHNSNTPQSKIAMVIVAPSQMLPTINDMPSGSIKGAEKSNDTYASSDFVFTGFNTQRLKYEVYKFTSIDESKQKYNSIKNEYSNYKLDNVNLGDEGTGFELADRLATVIFRKANTVVKVELVGQYGAYLSEVKSYAKLINTPTSSVIIEQKTNSESGLNLVADTKTLTVGETWNLGSGYALIVMDIDQKANPKNAWLSLSINGNKLDDKALKEGEMYNFNNVFKTKIESISDTEVKLRDTYIEQ